MGVLKNEQGMIFWPRTESIEKRLLREQKADKKRKRRIFGNVEPPKSGQRKLPKRKQN